MKLRSLALLLRLLGVGFCAFACFCVTTEGQALAQVPPVKGAEKPAGVRAAQAQQPGQALRPFPDYAMRGVPQKYPRLASAWQTREKALYEKLLAVGRFDVLVVPFQVEGWGLDSATRSVMTAMLASAIARAEGAKVPDPYLVARALGERQRQIRPEDIYRLANAIGARRIVWGFVGHDLKAMTLLVMAQERPASAAAEAAWNTPVAARRLDSVALGDDRSPVAAFESLVPEIVNSLGMSAEKVAARKEESQLGPAGLPKTPLGLTTGHSNAARDAYAFLLLAALAPHRLSRTKERFVEKAFLALGRLTSSSPDYRVLRARAYMMMNYRPAAIQALGVAKTNEEKAVLAALNGNLPELRAAVARETSQLKRVLQKLDEARIASHYDVTDSNSLLAEIKALNLPGPIWLFLVSRAGTQEDAWMQHDNTQLKLLLDHELPVKGASLEEIMRGAMALGDPLKAHAAAELSAFDHGRRFLEADMAKWCCQFSIDKPGVLDYMDLLQAIGHDNLLRRIDFFAHIQGAPAAALQFSNSLEAVYRGHPYYALMRSRAEFKAASGASGAERDGLLKSSYENAFNAMFWEQEQSYVSNDARHQIHASGRNDYGWLDNLYFRDMPFRPYYWTWAAGGNPAIMRDNNEAALKNATREFGTVPQLAGFLRIRNDAEAIKTLLKSIDGRFVGAPQRNEFLAEERLARGDIKSAVLLYRENLALMPMYWDSYRDLGKILFETGEVKEASEVFLSYPGFKGESRGNRVQISNFAFETGSYFYWSGHFDLAEPLYSIAAATKTGSGAEITSELRLKLLTGNLHGAMSDTLRRAQRYNDSYAYRDYLGMLHATGRSKDAWAAFNALVAQLPKPHLWETALAGHHIAGMSETQVIDWAKQEHVRNTAERTNTAARYLVRFATTDRVPSKELPAQLNEIDHPIWQLEGPHRFVVSPSPDGSTGAVLGPDIGGRQSMLPLGVFAASKKQRVKSHFAYFAEAYRAIKTGNHAAAKAAFDEAATLYDMATAHVVYALPYYAVAAAKAGDTSGVEAILQRFRPEVQRFDYHLARAVLAGVAGNMDAATKALRLARYRRPHTETRPLLTQYTYGDICELLAQATKHEGIREMAVNWARQAQKFEPWQSWSYAIEAALTTDPQNRRRAMAMLHYLDPKSARLSAFKQSEINDAVKAYGRINLFLRKTPETGRQDAT